MMRRLPPLAVCVLAQLLLPGCALMPWEDPAWKASVETRRVPESRTDARSAARARLADVKTDAREDAGDARRAIERQSRPGAEQPAGEARQVVELLAYSQRLAALSAEEQGRELAAATQEHAREPSVYSRVRLALALSTPGTSFHDDARAAALLETVASQPARTPLRQLGALVHGLIVERIREQRRVAQLKEQIDGLRAIDRSLMDREPGKSK
jgi:hypothetical protein